MSKTYEVPAELRTDVGKGASRRLRRQKKVPAIVYGESREPTNIVLEQDFIMNAADEEGFHASILELKVADGRTQKVVLRDLQRHPYKPTILHVDFQRISDKHELRIEVPLHFSNEEVSPAGKMAGVVVQHLMTEIEISALPKDLPEYIEVDLANLEPGERVMLSEIRLPEGVKVPALEYGDDYDAALVSAIYIREGQGTGELAAEADAALAEGAEPELAEEELEGEEVEGEEAEGEEGEKGEKGEKGEGEESASDGDEDKQKKSR
ncbi:MAG: 50S ribosomal protein L25/general stress protein Ctc [Wenzhouxiangellaceae bacterium]|nr:50S ribosomal protein L25/general stress protein Ctc [Wenzhouxiangellaceae bacterium]